MSGVVFVAEWAALILLAWLAIDVVLLALLWALAATVARLSHSQVRFGDRYWNGL